MTIDAIVKLLNAITKLLEAVIWPVILFFIFTKYRSSLESLFSDLLELSFKGAGIEGSLKLRKTQAKAAAEIAAAVSQKDKIVESVIGEREANIIANIIVESITPNLIKKAEKSNILWVDDRPDNNIYERQSLQTLGVNFILAKSTEEALKELKKRSFDVIISDMGRPPDQQAGYTLLKQLRDNKNETPFIIYAGSRQPEHIAESIRRGAIGCTNRADELFEMVLATLRRNR